MMVMHACIGTHVRQSVYVSCIYSSGFRCPKYVWFMSCVGCGSLLSGFLRRLFLQVLLEDERVLVCVTAKQPMYKGQAGAGVAGRLQHPKLGVGHGHRCLSVSVHSMCGDVLAKVSGELVLSLCRVFVMVTCHCFKVIQQFFELMEWSRARCT